MSLFQQLPLLDKLLHQLQTIRDAIAALREYVARKSREQKETERLLASSPSLRRRFNHRQSTLLNHALRHTGKAYRVDVGRAEDGDEDLSLIHI